MQKENEDLSPFRLEPNNMTLTSSRRQVSSKAIVYLNVSDKKKQWITFKVSELEMRALEAYCQQTQRTKTDILREMIRRLPTYTNAIISGNNSSGD